MTWVPPIPGHSAELSRSPSRLALLVWMPGMVGKALAVAQEQGRDSQGSQPLAPAQFEAYMTDEMKHKLRERVTDR